MTRVPLLVVALVLLWIAAPAAASMSFLRSPFRSFCAAAICFKLLPIACRFDWTPSTVTVEMVVDLSSSTCCLMSARAEHTFFCARSSAESPPHAETARASAMTTPASLRIMS